MECGWRSSPLPGSCGRSRTSTPPGSIQNFESLGNYAGDHGIGFGPNILGQGNMTQGLTLMLEQGYIQPKS
jgi:hypothetical protein